MKPFLLAFALGFSTLLTTSAQASDWIDRSSAIFFPNELKSQIGASQTFPVFWWNFFVIQPMDGNNPNWQSAHSVCSKLKSLPASEFTQIQCEATPREFLPIIKPWAQDLIFRQSMPAPRELLNHLHQSLAQASLPSGDFGILEVLRNDPFQTWKDLKAHAEKRLPLHLDLKQGFLFDAKSGRILIPVQFAFAPGEGARTEAVLQALDHPILIGPHGSTFQNESRIKADMRVVSLAGLIILAVFAFVLYRIRMVKLVPLFGGVIIGTGLSAVITKLVFGSIHGLTLSFGAAIAGLAMDYAFQAALNYRSPSIWKSNFCGFCTTTVGLVVVMFSSIPLLRQMMFFALVAMAISYSVFYFFFKYLKCAEWFSVESSFYSPKIRKFQVPVSVVLVLIAFVGLFAVKPMLDLRQFDYQTSEQRELSRWVYETTELAPPLFAVHSGNELNALDEEKSWADLHHITVENRAEYLPEPAVTLINQKSWAAGWPGFLANLSGDEKKFFAPFLDSVHLNQTLIDKANVPVYVQHLTTSVNPGNEWISLWLPTNDSEVAEVRQAFPKTQSLSEVVSIFPKMLSRELGFMVPISIILALIFHLIYYRRLSYATIALLPFFTGLGLIILSSFLFHFALSFISIIALILVFGFSLDYGIFATDACIRENPSGMWTGITLAACSTIAGFVPLVFCKHPVLKDLGLTLFLGGIGTYLGAIWAIPNAVLAVKRRTAP